MGKCNCGKRYFQRGTFFGIWLFVKGRTWHRFRTNIPIQRKAVAQHFSPFY